MKFPGNNTMTFCPSALMAIIEEALNARAYDSKDYPIRVLGIQARADDNITTVFDAQITTDPKEPAA